MTFLKFVIHWNSCMKLGPNISQIIPWDKKWVNSLWGPFEILPIHCNGWDAENLMNMEWIKFYPIQSSWGFDLGNWQWGLYMQLNFFHGLSHILGVIWWGWDFNCIPHPCAPLLISVIPWNVTGTPWPQYKLSHLIEDHICVWLLVSCSVSCLCVLYVDFF